MFYNARKGPSETVLLITHRGYPVHTSPVGSSSSCRSGSFLYNRWIESFLGLGTVESVLQPASYLLHCRLSQQPSAICTLSGIHHRSTASSTRDQCDYPAIFHEQRLQHGLHCIFASRLVLFHDRSFGLLVVESIQQRLVSTALGPATSMATLP
jgi:hypothetical protein